MEATTISDITEAADVAVGSFYNHFGSKAEILGTVFSSHAAALAQINDHIFMREPDPAAAVAFIQKVFLTHAIADPVWGWFIVNASNDDARIMDAFSPAAGRHVRLGVEAGRFRTDSVPVAVRIILVSLISGMRDILEGGAGRDRPARIVQSLLQMLGLPVDEARTLANRRLPGYVRRLFDQPAADRHDARTLG